MEHFELGSCFRSYAELEQKVQAYCQTTHTKYFKKDCKFITSNFSSTVKDTLVYSELKLNCVHCGVEKAGRKRMRKERKLNCPAYFRLRLIESGAALQIVALNNRHNHPLELAGKGFVEFSKLRTKREDAIKQEDNLKEITLQIETGDSSDGSGDAEPVEFINVFIDQDTEANNVNLTFRGLCAPVFTVFNKDLSINVEAIPKYAKYLADSGIKAVLVHGTTGESMSMSVSERKALTEAWVNAVKVTKQHLMVQVGGCPLPDVLELAKHAEKIGVDSLLCLPELYFKPATSTELISYLKIVGEAAPKTPLLYYHIPLWTGVNINMAQFMNESVGKLPTFQGIKYTSNDLDGGAAAVKANNGKYAVFLGADTLISGAMALGFDSVIGTTLNIFPKLGVEIYNAVNESKISKSRELQNKLTWACSEIIKHGAWVPTMKVAMNHLSPINVGQARPPLANPTAAQKAEMETSLASFK